MKKLILIFGLFLLFTQISFSQIKNKEKLMYIGIGTSLSSFIGGDFGSAFSIRYSTYHDNNYPYYYNGQRYRYSNYYEYDNNNGILNPLQVDVALGVNVHNNLSIQLESSFLWHTRGMIKPNFETGTIGNYDYMDRNDNSTLIAIPIILSAKVFPLGKKTSGFYVSGGVGYQYMQESAERIRSVYYNNSYYDYSFYEYPMADFKGRDWFMGYKVSAGFSYKLSKDLSGDIELRFTNFFPKYKNDYSQLNMFRTPNIGNIALGTKVYFGF